MARRQMLLHSVCEKDKGTQWLYSMLESKENSGVVKYRRTTSEIFRSITISPTPLYVNFLVIFYLDRIDEGASTIWLSY